MRYSRHVDAGGGGFLDHRKREYAQRGDPVVPGAVELVVDRPPHPAAVRHQPTGAGAGEQVTLGAERPVEELDHAALTLDRVLQQGPERAGALGVEPQIRNPRGLEVDRRHLRQKAPIHDRVILQHQELVRVSLEELGPRGVVAGVAPQLAGVHRPPLGDDGLVGVVAEPGAQLAAGVEPAPGERGAGGPRGEEVPPVACIGQADDHDAGLHRPTQTHPRLR